MKQQRSILPLLLAAGATIVALCWAVVLLQPEEGTPVSPAPTPHATAPQTPDASLELTPIVPPLEPVASSRPQIEPLPVEPKVTAIGPQAVFGRVVDASTGEPVQSFQVTVLEHRPGDPLERLAEVEPQAFHRREGIFRVDTEPGIYDVVISAPGYLPAATSKMLVPAADLNPQAFRLDKGPGIAGLVIDENNASVQSVRLFLHVLKIHDPRQAPPRVQTATSGLDGGFSFSPLPAGEYAVSPLRPDNEIDRVAGIRVYEGTTNIRVFLTPRHTLQISLRDDGGRPVSRARITLRGADHFATAHSNRSGLAVLHHVPDGRYTISARAPGYDDISELLELAGGMSDEVRFYTLVRHLD